MDSLSGMGVTPLIVRWASDLQPPKQMFDFALAPPPGADTGRELFRFVHCVRALAVGAL